MVDASARFVAAGMRLPLDYVQPIRDQILGASITGVGHTMGIMDAELVEDPQHAAIRLQVTGRTDLQTIGRQRRVTVWGDGVTTFTAEKTLTVDRFGFSEGVSESHAESDNWPRRIAAPPLVRCLAWRRVQRQRCEGNRIVARHAEPMIAERLDEDAGAIVRSANRAYAREFRSPLLRRGVFPEQLDFDTSDSRLRAVILQAAQGQLGAPAPPPPLPAALDIGICLHESACNSMWSRFR
jgi:hypothetical protein